MEMTEAWVLDRGDTRKTPGRLELRTIKIPALNSDELLLEPLFGCWEGNYSHALERTPIDICVARHEQSVVLGNCGVVRALQADPEGRFDAGQICLLTGNAVWDRDGYMMKAHAYDAPGTMGLMAKRTKARARQLIALPEGDWSLRQWAAFSLRYLTAWANWRVALGAWRLQMEGAPQVWAWGGGVALAELQLARLYGADCSLLASRDARLKLATSLGITAIDRRPLSDLDYDRVRDRSDAQAHARYLSAESAFLETVKSHTADHGVDIFIDNIGSPVFRATLRALARQGVVATAGWKHGMRLTYLRARQSIDRHILVHTHYASHQEAQDAVAFAVDNDWFPPEDALGRTWSWEEIGALSEAYQRGVIDSYFPIFSIN